MAGERKQISASLRWNIFFRDGFACRYCGAQAGESGVELAIDHVLSVADGGDNRVDNLVTACRDCNSGKGAKSIRSVPTSDEVLARVKARMEHTETLRDSISRTLEAHKEIEQQIVNIKCDAYGVESVQIDKGEMTSAKRLISEFGVDRLIEWYNSAASRGVGQHRAIRYVHGCARNTREQFSPPTNG